MDNINTPATWATAVVAVMIFMGQALQLLQAYLKAKSDKETAAAAARAANDAKEAATNAAVQAREVRQDLVAVGVASGKKMNEIAQTSAATHTLVNSARGEQLKIVALALRRVVDMRKEMGLEPNLEDVSAAELAEKLYHDHMTSQAIVDKNL